MDACGVAKAVLVPVSWGGDGDSNVEAAKAVQKYPTRFGIMSHIALNNPASAAKLPGLRKQPGMLGVRCSFTHAAKAYMTDGSADWLWKAAEDAQVPLMVLPPGLIPQLGKVAEQHPGLKIIIDHFAIETRGPKDDAAFWETPELVKLAKLPNVAIKASALATYTTQAYPYPVVHKYVRQVFDAYGPKRMFWGSDLSRLRTPYRDMIALFTEELPWLTAQDKEWVMGRGLCEWLGWSYP